MEPGSAVSTDDHASYGGLDGKGFHHDHVNHSRGEYVGAGSIHTNSVESMWALLKRGLYGVWHHCQARHLHRYVNEATFRLNEGNVKIHTLDRLDAFAGRSFHHGLTWRKLIA